MASCRLCDGTGEHISEGIGVCLDCIRARPREALAVSAPAHARSRRDFGLPETPPRDPGGVPCVICVNECRIPEGGLGYCGLRGAEDGRLTGVSVDRGKLSWYHDPLPTNCVGDWICPGGTGAGYPRYANCPGPERGYRNLAVFFHACSFDCLYCQNWHFRSETLKPLTRSARELVDAVDERTSCICYFGGDPSPQLSYSLKASRLALGENRGRILRICWETNGTMRGDLLDEMIGIALESGGCIKFDLKARDGNLHEVLAGVTNRRTLENFRRAAGRMKERPEPPLLLASTLLVPGYIDADEVGDIARFIAALDRDIPYSLLAFYPHFCLSDLPTTSRTLAWRCRDAAREAGLKNVRVGNVHLLRDA
jgi:pyruvate formate lyase activating enzyme